MPKTNDDAIDEILARGLGLTRQNLHELDYYLAIGDIDGAVERRNMAYGTVWQIVSTQEYVGDITAEDIAT